MMQLIIEINETDDFESFPDELKAALTDAGISIEMKLAGTKAVDGRILILTTSKYDDTVLNDLFNGEYMHENKTYNFDLGWQVVAEENVKINQGDILPFMSDINLFDDDGNATGFEVVTDITDKLQTFSGRNWVY